MRSFFSLNRSELEHILAEHGAPRAHAKPIMSGAYRSGAVNPWCGPQLPVHIQHLGQRWPATSLAIDSVQVSPYDGATKFLLRLDDDQVIESVLMPEKSRITVCVSSQVGCRQACTFCHTGRMGLRRQLADWEIVGQVVTLNRWLAEHPEWLDRHRLPQSQRVSNVVFMGMGEPMDNVDQVVRAVGNLIDHFGGSIAKRKITVSTAGHLDGLKKFFELGAPAQIAISVHSAFEAERSKLMPINRRYALTEVLDFLRTALSHRNDHVMIQYTVIRGVNDQQRHAHKLAECLEGLPVKVNLIPLNSFGSSSFAGPSPEALNQFANTLASKGLRTTIRFSKGQDIAAACGQLVS